MVQSTQQSFMLSDRSIDQERFKQALGLRFGPDFLELIKKLENLELLKPAAVLDSNSQIFISPISPIPAAVLGLEIALVLFELNTDPVAILAGFLVPQLEFVNLISKNKLDYLEKTLGPMGPEVLQIIRGVEAMNLAQGLLDKQKLKSDLDGLRKMFLSMVNDIRVVLVALAKQLVLMRHIKTIENKQALILARTVMQLYAPLANRLGLGQLKWELEDRSFRQLSPLAYQNITQALDEKRQDREKYLAEVLVKLIENLKQENIPAEVTGRVKHIFSIYKKMQKKHLDFEQLFDIQAMRILVKDVSHCYRALGLIHELWMPIESEFDDYISNPKPNGYQSIHTVVKGPLGKNIEIQIRTFSMHSDSELGVAAHWRYKEEVNRDQAYEQRITWLRNLLEWQEEVAEEPGLEKNLDYKNPEKNSLLDQSIYVFTPEGKVLDLPAGATPIDFAYRIHTDLGHRCRGAKVHGHIVNLTYGLRTGDIVEILPSKESRPSRDWLSDKLGYVKSPRTKSKIAAWFRHEDGLESLNLNNLSKEKLEKNNKEKLEKEELEKQELEKNKIFKKTELKNSGDFILAGVDNILISPAGCCRPIAGDLILGYITQGKGIRVHRADCSQMLLKSDFHPERLIKISWAQEIKGVYPVDLLIFSQDRSGLLKDITTVIMNEKVSISGLMTHLDRKSNTTQIALTIDIKNREQVSRLCELLKRVAGVVDVVRR